MKMITAAGKRKSAIAKATIKPGKGRVRINNKILAVHEPKMARMKLEEPLILAGDIAKDIDIKISVAGGGYIAQAEAARLAVARALVKYNKKLEKTFLEYDRHLLVADVRRKEPHKPNTSKSARAKRQKSYR
jgi:small subunit ribosomal protein S9